MTLSAGLAKTLSVKLDPQGVLHVSAERDELLVSATEWLSYRRVVHVRTISKIVGLWSWRCVAFRELYSVFHATYSFLAAHPLDSWVPLWRSVAQELRILSAISVLAVCDLSLPWSTEVFMTDTSEEGFGVVSATAGLEEVLGEVAFAERRGWLTEVEATYTLNEAHAEDEDDEAVQRGAAPPHDDSELLRFAKAGRYVVHLFSGRSRPLDLQHYLEREAQISGLLLSAASIDVQVDLQKGNLADAAVVGEWARRIREGQVVLLHAGPPCSTWSRARHAHLEGGPRPLRSPEEPRGLRQGLRDDEAEVVALGNALLRASLRLIEAALEQGAGVSLEHPADLGGGGASPAPGVSPK